MQDLDKTTLFKRTEEKSTGLSVTIFDGTSVPERIRLDEYGKSEIYFGRSRRNDIVLNSKIVSSFHGRFLYSKGVWYIEDKEKYGEEQSTNGILYNNTFIISKQISDGDFIRIDGQDKKIAEGVLFVFSTTESNDEWKSLEIFNRKEIKIGRAEDCEIKLPHISVSKCHARIVRKNDGFYIVDNESTNGVLVNGKRIDEREKLQEKDVIVITNSKLIFTSSMIHYYCYKSGISVDVSKVVVKRGKGKKSFIASDNVSLNIRPGELVAVIGGSGAGKSTILNCMCGYLKPTEGEVFINGIDLYKNFDSLKKLVGYVPQSDIVYENLTLYDMLSYTAKLRLPKDTTKEERDETILNAIKMVELTEKKDSLIKSLSGGQRKRASIAVELLSNPNLLFLDEPASGLDPGTERNLMKSLRDMADYGKTIILVTHSTLQLKMCDKIVFMGNGGKLCFFGSYEEALEFFEVSDIVDIYSMLTDESEKWSRKFEKNRNSRGTIKENNITSAKVKKNRLKQLGVMCNRFVKLTLNDKQKTMMFIIQAPILIALISLVADGEEFKQYEMTKSLFFALSCSAFWIGMLNAIQEICKERTILRREYMTGLSLTSYVLSKVIVLGVISFFQSLMLTGIFAWLIGVPEKGVFIHPILEVFITTFLTAIVSAAMGLVVSSFFTSGERAMTCAPVLLMPQILFSGLVFKLGDHTEKISWFTVCRWSMEGYGTTANLNSLPLRLQQEGIQLPHEAEKYFDFTTNHLLTSWGILFIFLVGFLIMARIALTNIAREKS